MKDEAKNVPHLRGQKLSRQAKASKPGTCKWEPAGKENRGQLDDARYASEGLVQSERFPMLSLLRKIRSLDFYVKAQSQRPITVLKRVSGYFLNFMSFLHPSSLQGKLSNRSNQSVSLKSNRDGKDELGLRCLHEAIQEILEVRIVPMRRGDGDSRKVLRINGEGGGLKSKEEHVQRIETWQEIKSSLLGPYL
ncbi:hypothetical protein Tco_0268827 [Tanacetum coccineum]